LADDSNILKAAVQELVELKRLSPGKWNAALEAELARLVDRLMK
jgi:hypothetical protein